MYYRCCTTSDVRQTDKDADNDLWVEGAVRPVSHLDHNPAEWVLVLSGLTLAVVLVDVELSRRGYGPVG